jgi:hypothetical protein
MKMSKRAKVCLAIAAVMAMVAVGVPAVLVSAGASTSAEASTTACGSSCTSPSVESLGSGEVLTTSGSSVSMSAASSSNSGQDWTVEAEGNVTAGNDAGIVSSKLMLNYQNSNLVEFQYAPNGVPSNKCLAENLPSSSELLTTTVPVGLLQCGVSTATLWIVDQGNALSQYDDLISANGIGSCVTTTITVCSLTNAFAEPGVLTVSSSGAVSVTPLSEIGGVISPGQAWTAYTAPDQSALRAAIKKSAQKSSF